MVWFAGAAYCDPTLIQKWDCGEPCEKNPSMNVTSVHQNDEDKVFGFVGYDATLEAIVVSFRGTDPADIQNWALNLDAIQEKPYKDMPTVAVHSGFYKAYQVLKGGVMVSVNTLAGEVGAGKGLLLTGHSLGASMASLLALDLVREYGFKNVTVMHFGSPRTGNYNFHFAMTQHVKNVWRVTHADDLVAHVPTEFMGYYHISNEIYFPAKIFDGKYVVCNHSGEDPSCSNSCSDKMACVSIEDHLHYLGVPLSRSCKA